MRRWTASTAAASTRPAARAPTGTCSAFTAAAGQLHDQPPGRHRAATTPAQSAAVRPAADRHRRSPAACVRRRRRRGRRAAPVDHGWLRDAVRPTRPRWPARSRSSTAAPARSRRRSRTPSDAARSRVIIGNNVGHRPARHGRGRRHASPSPRSASSRATARRSRASSRPSPSTPRCARRPATTDNSYRWLMGEEVGPGGALRDMWNPNCYGNPGKVTDIAVLRLLDRATTAACTPTPACPTKRSRCWWTAASTTARTCRPSGSPRPRTSTSARSSTRCRRRTSPSTPTRSSSPAPTCVARS